MIKYLILVFICACSACSEETPKQPPYFEVQGNNAERIAQISKLLKQNVVPLKSILDAHFVEETKGETKGLGSTDYCSFYTLNVAPESIADWVKVLKPLASDTKPNSSSFTSPAQAKSWWLTKQEYESLKFYDAFDLTNRNGWIGISQTGHIFITGCTS